MSSSLLQKAQQALNEKTNKVLPGNIKSGVTMFGVTGTYGGGGGSEIIEFKIKNQVTINFSALATIMSQQLSADDKNRPIVRSSSGFDPCLQVSGIYDKFDDTQTIRIFGISVNTYDTLGLTLGNHNVVDIYTADSETEEYFASGMTAQDLITVFSLIGTKTVSVPKDYVENNIMYGISAIKMFFTDGSDTANIYNVSNVFTFDVRDYNENIDPNDILTVDWGEIADIIRDNCTEGELATPVNAFDSGYCPSLILSSDGEFTISTSVYDNADIFVSISEQLVTLSVGSEERCETLSMDDIFTASTEAEIPNPCTLGDLCNMFDTVGVGTHTCFTGEDYANMEYTFCQPITSIRVLGPALDKIIDFSNSQYGNPVSVVHS